MNQSIVCCLDVLGYSDLVKNKHSDDEYIKKYEDVLNKSLSILNKLKSNSSSKDSSYNEEKNNLIDKIRIITFSDTIIFILYLEKIDKEQINNCMFLFLNLISRFSTLFIQYIGNTLRGGMSIGQHYDNYDKYRENKDIKLVMFSKSLIESHKLESESSFYPRVLINKKLNDYLQKISFKKYNEFFYQDFFHETCLRIYGHFVKSKYQSSVVEELIHIKDKIQNSIDDNQGNRKILEKLFYFSNYHDYECKQLNIKNNECYFNY
ncbi:MAG: hypothetical protein WC849_03625 [Candidatus Paceibacterota bacterium]